MLIIIPRLCSPDGAGSCPERVMMYYINDGVYGSMSCITFDPAHSKLEPYPHRVNINSIPIKEFHRFIYLFIFLFTSGEKC